MSGASATAPILAVTFLGGAKLRTLVWAKQISEAAGSRIVGSTLLIIQELKNFILVVALIDKPDMLGCDAALPVDDEVRRKGIDTAVKLRHFLSADHDAVVDLVRGDVGPDRLPSVIVEGDAQHGEVAVLIFLLELDEPGDLNLAGSAPGGPEVQQHDFSAIVRQVDGRSASVRERESGRRLAVLVGLHSGVG